MTADPHICGRCAARQETCCQLEIGTEGDCFPLSLPEKNRILAAGYSDFWQSETTTSEFLRSMYSLFPDERRSVQRIFPLGGVHERLATKVDGRCVFLGKLGCELVREIRPHYCRLFPFWVVGGKIRLLDDGYCLAARLEIRQGLQELGCLAKDIFQIYTNLVSDWGLKSF